MPLSGSIKLNNLGKQLRNHNFENILMYGRVTICTHGGFPWSFLACFLCISLSFIVILP